MHSEETSLVEKYTRLWFGKAQEYLGLLRMPYETIDQSLKLAVYQIYEITSIQFLYILRLPRCSPCFNLSGHSFISTVTKENTNCPYTMVHIILICCSTLFRVRLSLKENRRVISTLLFKTRLKKCFNWNFEMDFGVDYVDMLIWDFSILSCSNIGTQIHQEACFNDALFLKQFWKGEVRAN